MPTAINWFDMLYPAFAFVMVIILPSCVAVWATYKTIIEKKPLEGER